MTNNSKTSITNFKKEKDNEITMAYSSMLRNIFRSM